MIALIVIGALVLAFANGANDNSRGVATLVGGRTLSMGPALRYGGAMTFLGSVAAVFLAEALLKRFTGAGLVHEELLLSPAFPGCVVLAAATTVLLATRIAMPISTTHAIVGSIAGVGISAGAIHVPATFKIFLLPLAVSPMIALCFTAVVYPIFRWTRNRLGVTHRTCVCIEEEFHPVSVTKDGAVIMAQSGLKLSDHRDAVECFQRYGGRVVGIDAQRALDWSHIVSGGAINFARGINDTPKIAALMLAASSLAGGGAILGAGLAIGLGSLLAARRVAETMSYRISGMNDGQAFSANLVTAVLVISASRWGLPVSTTHVSCGSLFGIGLVNRQAHWKVIGRIVLAWVTTLPFAAALGFLLWRLLGT